MTHDKKRARERYKARQKRIRQRKFKAMQHKRSMLTVSIVVFMLFVILSVSSVSLHQKKVKYEKQIKLMEELIKEEEKRAEELNELEEYAQTDEYVEDIARDKLGLVYPNEIIFIPK